MTKQKRGFLLFLASLIPGAGEMYMGFRKQGISIMALFWAIFAFAASNIGFSWVMMFLPIVWFYSFFNVHNLKSLSEEEFYSVEDSFILHFDELLGDAGNIVTKYRKVTAIILILVGFSILWSILTDFIFWILPDTIAYGISLTIGRLPQIIIAVALILAGFYIITDKKRKLESDAVSQEETEHFWEPYRPYQKAQEEQAAADSDTMADSTETTEESTTEKTE